MLLVEAKVTDSTHLELAKPIMVGSGKRVIIVVAEPMERDAERREWVEGGVPGLAAAYGETEPVYTPAMIREKNPVYGT